MNLAKGTKLVAVYSRSQERAEAFAEEHDVKAAYDSVGLDGLPVPQVTQTVVASARRGRSLKIEELTV